MTTVICNSRQSRDSLVLHWAKNRSC